MWSQVRLKPGEKSQVIHAAKLNLMRIERMDDPPGHDEIVATLLGMGLSYCRFKSAFFFLDAMIESEGDRCKMLVRAPDFNQLSNANPFNDGN